jgi:hypothetical protein
MTDFVVRLYLDLETYRPVKENAFVNEKVIAVGLTKDETPYERRSLTIKVKPIIFAEWKRLREPDLVKKIFRVIEEARIEHRFTVICGFNILRFDLPLLLAKAVHYRIKTAEVASQILHNAFTVDYFQQLLPANDNLFKGMTLARIVEVASKLKLKPPAISRRGVDIAELYERKRYGQIEKHLRKDVEIVRWLDLYGAKRLLEKRLRSPKPLFH